MGKKSKDPIQISHGGGHNFERTTCTTSGNQHLGRCLAGTDGCFSCGRKVYKMKDLSIIKAKGKVVNQASLYPNAPKKNPSYEIVA